ncbi:hypothetical protein ACFLT1_08610 [Bacteroidota bacterium]
MLLSISILFISINAYPQKKELSVLFVGNSYTYNNNLAHLVAIMSEGTDTKIRSRRSVAPGAFLWEHWNGRRGLNTRAIIETGDFDIVVLQDNSMATIQSPDSTLKYVNRFAALNAQYGAKTFLFNTWAREKVPQFQKEIDQKYAEAAALSGATRVPVGEAWQLAMDIRHNIDLYISDGSHPTDLGSLLTATMFVKAITGELPDQIPVTFRVKDEFGEDVDIFYADPLDYEFCKRIAKEIIKANLAL